MSVQASNSLWGPAYNAYSVTPHDSNNFSQGVCKRLFVGTGGTATVVFDDDSTVQYTAVTGTYLEVMAKRVNNTGTTALLMIAEY